MSNVAEEALRSWLESFAKTFLAVVSFSAKYVFRASSKITIRQVLVRKLDSLASTKRWVAKAKKTYNSGYSLVVTHPTTNPPI